MPELFEIERAAPRGEVAEVLRAIADGVESGSVALDEDGDDVVVDVPTEVEYELDLETDGRDREAETDRADGEDRGDEAAEADGDAGAGERERVDDSVEVELEVELAWLAGPAEDVAIPPAHHEYGGRDADSAARFELFTDSAGEWRWRLVHTNGNVIADGGEGYTRKANARKGLESVRANAPGAAVVEVSTEE